MVSRRTAVVLLENSVHGALLTFTQPALLMHALAPAPEESGLNTKGSNGTAPEWLLFTLR